MITTKVTTKDLAITFAFASNNKDIKALSSLLSEKGTFNIQTSKLNTIDVNKKRFLNWYSKKLEETRVESIDYDQCLHCSFGSPVVLFNGGSFPRQAKDNSERSKTGIMVASENDQITILRFCYVFFHTDNDFICDNRMREAIKRERENGIAPDPDLPF